MKPNLEQLPAARLREMLFATEQAVGKDSESAAIIRRALESADKQRSDEMSILNEKIYESHLRDRFAEIALKILLESIKSAGDIAKAPERAYHVADLAMKARNPDPQKGEDDPRFHQEFCCGGLSVRAMNVLSRAGVSHKSQLIEKGELLEKFLLDQKNCGKATADEIIKWLVKNN